MWSDGLDRGEKRIRLWIIPWVAAMILTVSGWLIHTWTQDSLKAQYTTELSAILRADTDAIDLWIQEQKWTALHAAKDARTRALIQDLVELSRQEGTTTDSLLLSRQLAMLRERLIPACRINGYIDFVVTSVEGVNLAAWLDEPIGQRGLGRQTGFVTQALSGATVVTKPFPAKVMLPDANGIPRPNRPTMFVASPVHSEKGRVIAALSFRARPEMDFAEIFTTTRLGQTGATYAFDDQGYMLTVGRSVDRLKAIGLLPDRRGAEAVLNIQIRDPGGDLTQGYVADLPSALQPLTKMAASAIAGHDGVDVDGYRDYRGVEVIGAWTWLAQHGFGVAAEIEVSEAYQSLDLIRQVFSLVVVCLTLASGMGLLLDISGRRWSRKLHEAESYTRDVLDNLDAAMVLTDDLGQIKTLNLAAQRLFGFSTPEILNQDISVMLPDARTLLTAPAQTGHGVDPSRAFTYHFGVARGKDDQTMQVRVAIRHLSRGSQKLIQYGIHEKTVGTETDERLSQDLADARRDVQAQAQLLAAESQQLKRATASAEAANRAKSQFLANMSHEIRTPMTAILGYADLLQDPDRPLKQRQQFVETIRRNGQHLLAIINEILDLSKIEAGKMTIERVPCSPAQIVCEVTSMMKGRADAKDLGLEVEYRGPIPKTIRTDPTRLRQILVNLIGNAIKFTQQGSVRIAVELLTSKDPSQSLLATSITDSGIGISPDRAAELFNPYTQAEASTARTYGGTGLGLAISKRLAQALGGDIQLASEPGQGSTFTVTLATGPLDGVAMLTDPRAESGGFSDSANERLQEINLKGRILLAEDGPDNRQYLALVLSSAGAEVTTAEDGQIALDVAAQAQQDGTPFDLILMDMQMPNLNGYAASTRLRDQGFNGPIIALTAHAMAGERARCLAAGCDDFATKPIDRFKLLKIAADTMNKPTRGGKAVDQSSSTSTNPSSGGGPLYSEYADDPDMTELVEMFVCDLPERVEQIERSIQDSDLTSLKDLAHQLKGAAGGYGFSPITEAAAVVEKQTKEEAGLDQIKQSVDELLSLCHRATSNPKQEC